MKVRVLVEFQDVGRVQLGDEPAPGTPEWDNWRIAVGEAVAYAIRAQEREGHVHIMSGLIYILAPKVTVLPADPKVTAHVEVAGGVVTDVGVVDSENNPVPFDYVLDDKDVGVDEIEVIPAGVKMLALVTDDGTACAETGVCSDHDTPALRAKIEADADKASVDGAIPGNWVDVTLNDAVYCQECGRYAGGESKRYKNLYTCPQCGHEWEDFYSAMPDDDCPSCGTRHVTPYASEELSAEEQYEDEDDGE